MSDGITIEFGSVEKFVWSGMARGGPVDTNWRLRVRINGEHVPPMDEFNIDGAYNMRLPPYNIIKLGATFFLSGDQTTNSFIGRIDGSYNDSNMTLRRHEPTVDICLTYNGRGYWETVSERAFAAGLVDSGREYLTLAREEVIPAALEHTDLYEPEAEMHHEDLDELDALLDDLEDFLQGCDELARNDDR